MRDNEIQKAIEVGKTYVKRSEMQKNDFHYYYILKKNKLLDEVIPLKHPPLTYNMCYNVAKQYEMYSDFRTNSNKYYCKALAKGWIKDYTWLQKGFYDMNARIHIVYVYEYPKLKYVYVGRTMRPSVRKLQHARDVNDSIYRFIKGHKLTFEDMVYKVVKDNLTAEESQYYEKYYIDDYVNQQWNLINKAKAGSLGGNIIIWDYNACYKEALKYASETSFKHNSLTAYVKSSKMGWKKDYTWLKKYDPYIHYTYDECYQTALQCKNKNDFARRFSSKYRYSKLNNFIDNFKWLLPKVSNDNIIEYDLDGNFVCERQNNEFKGAKRQSVLNCANGKHQYGYGRIWKFKSDVLDKNGEILIKINGIKENGIPIIQYSADGYFIKEHKSIKSASEEIGCTSSSLCDALQSAKTIFCYGFAWRYKDKVLDNNGNIMKQITLRNDKVKKVVVLYDGNGKFIKEYSSLSKAYKEFSRYKVDWTLYDKWKDSKTHKNIKRFNTIWRYKDNVLNNDGTIKREIRVVY
jgi:hypothetical protein